MNLVIMRLTWRTLLGHRRALLLLVGPILMLLVAFLTRLQWHGSLDSTVGMVNDFSLGTLLPLMCLLIGTGAIGPEIEDGSIVYLLAKPLPRRTIVFSKLAVVFVSALLFVVIPVMLSVAICGDSGGHLTVAYCVTAVLAAITYSTVFFALAVISHNPVIIGLIYALLWETILGGYAPGVQTLSVRQWALAPAEHILGGRALWWGVKSEVSLTTGIVMMIVTIIAATYIAIRKLQTLRLRTVE